MPSQITSLMIVYSGADQRKHQSFGPLAFLRGIHRDRWIHKWPVTRKIHQPTTGSDTGLSPVQSRTNLWSLLAYCFIGPLRTNSRNITQWGRDKMTGISKRPFQSHFLEWKCMVVYWSIYASLGLSELTIDMHEKILKLSSTKCWLFSLCTNVLIVKR